MNMGGSLVVTLPWNWLNYHNVKAGDKVEIITHGFTAEIKLLNNGNNKNGEKGNNDGGEEEIYKQVGTKS